MYKHSCQHFPPAAKSVVGFILPKFIHRYPEIHSVVAHLSQTFQELQVLFKLLYGIPTQEMLLAQHTECSAIWPQKQIYQASKYNINKPPPIKSSGKKPPPCTGSSTSAGALLFVFVFNKGETRRYRGAVLAKIKAYLTIIFFSWTQGALKLF